MDSRLRGNDKGVLGATIVTDGMPPNHYYWSKGSKKEVVMLQITDSARDKIKELQEQQNGRLLRISMDGMG